MTDGVDGGVPADKPASRDTRLDLGARQAGLQELYERNVSVLLRRKRSDTSSGG
jgi:hypothetical protein